MLSEDILISLVSGQAFRFKEHGGVYTGVIGDRVYSLSKDNIDTIETDPILHNFFDLDTNYTNIKEYLSKKSPVLKRAIKSAPELRILHQNSEEMILSFVLTSCNNIPRISKMINALSMTFGKQIIDNYYTFPSASSIALTTEDKLRKLGLGFRAPFILEIARRIDSGEFEIGKISNLDDNEAREYLMMLPGVGAKVADCVLLFGYHRLNVFPKDVHIKRVMEKYFPNETETVFSPYAGVAQQFLFLEDLSL